MNKPTNWRKSLLGAAIGFYASAPVLAAPGELADAPLIVTQVAKPNIMLLLDSSGSMRAFVPETPYDADVTYGGACPDSLKLGNTHALWIAVKDDGRVFYEQFDPDATGYAYTQYDWGTTAGTGHTGNAFRCLDPDLEYDAYLYGTKLIDTDDSADIQAAYGVDSWVAWGTDRGTGRYNGNYLNWYFSDNGASGANFGANARQKPDVETRTEVAAGAASGLVDSLSNVRIGLTRFNGSEGGTLVKNIQDIATTGYRTALKDAIDAITPAGNTPLAETMEGIGRYFIEGFETQNLVLHPDSGSPVTKAGNTIFVDELVYSTGESEPTASAPVMETDKYCQQNFIIGLTDGLPTSDGGVDDDLVNYADDGDAYALNDVAKALYEMDLRPDISDPTGLNDTNNIVTHMIGFADETLIDDPLLASTAENGGGISTTAEDTASLLEAFDRIKASIAATTGTLASVAFNSTSVKNGDAAVFQAKFDTADWSGNLIAYPLDSRGNLPADGADEDSDPDTYAWEASEKLDALGDSGVTSRVIMTYDGSDGVLFSYSSDTAAPTSAHAADLTMDSTANAADAEIRNRLEYIRGSRTLEGTDTYRSRGSRLGDIVNSTPVYVGDSDLRWPLSFGVDGNRHVTDFVKAPTNPTGGAQDGISDRLPVLYVGANDGKLHGFNATVGETDSGKEVFAYIPRALLSADQNEGLHYLTDSSYVHKFYVDLTPSVSDIYTKGTSTGTVDWRTVLIGGLRAGGKGYFALDITNPADFSNTSLSAANTVMWEFTSDDNADLGYSFSRPVIAKMNNGKWAAIFGNGYNSDDGTAGLFILFIEDGLDGWSASDYKFIEVSGADSDKNGLSTPAAADVNGDGLVDRIYAGDLKGNMWAFDVDDSNVNKWEIALKSGSTFVPLFTAEDSSGNAQPITSAPVLALNSENTPSGRDPNILVMFGTGQYITNDDVTSLDTQSMYAVWDNDSGKELDRSDLEVRTLTTATVTGATSRLREVTGDAIDWSREHGWYMDLLPGTSGADAAERIAATPLLRRSVLLFNTIIPDATPCSNGGSGWLMSLNYATGLAPDEAVFDADNDGDIDADDVGFVGQEVLGGLPAQSGVIEDIQFTPTSDGTLGQREINVGTSVGEGRLGWQELTPKK